MNCLLCPEQREANQTGSHIFTHSLISKCINEEGKKGRDNELMFGLSQNGEKDIFFGRNISPEKIEEVKGKELTDDELINNQNDLVVDNIYCSDCEKLFAKIEGVFSENILSQIRDNNVYAFQYPDNIVIRLYFYIQIWRASSSKYNDWQLSDKSLEEHLKSLIYKGCLNWEKGLDKDLEAAILSFPLIINYLETVKEEESSNLVFIPNEKFPYLLFLCDFVIEFFPVLKMVEPHSYGNYYGLNNDIKEDDINYKENVFKIRFIKNDDRIKMNFEISKNEFASFEIKHQIEFLSEQFIKANNVPPDEFIVAQFIEILTNWDGIPLTERLSKERISNIVEELIKNNSKK